MVILMDESMTDCNQIFNIFHLVESAQKEHDKFSIWNQTGKMWKWKEKGGREVEGCKMKD